MGVIVADGCFLRWNIQYCYECDRDYNNNDVIIIFVGVAGRNGSAVELVGLCYSAVSFLSKMHQQSSYPHSGVKIKVDGGVYALRF